MLYRIDLQHFLTHMIDHFTSDELKECTYAVISARIKNNGNRSNCCKINELFPPPEIVAAYSQYQDDNMLEGAMMEYLNPKIKQRGDDFIDNKIYLDIIKPLLNHQDVVLVCDQSENVYLDTICKYLDKEYHMQTIDLNKLFTEGHVGPIYIDRDDIRDRAVDVRRASARKRKESLETSRGGREELLGKMNKKEKIAKLKELGIDLKKTETNEDNLNALLFEVWVDSEELEDYREWSQ